MEVFILYRVIAAIDGAAIQIPMFLISGEGGALGASGVRFGLLVIALLWAPENDIEVFYWFITAGTFKVSVFKMSALYLFL